HLREGRPLPVATAAITVDDGYSDFYEIAWPVLRRRNMTATVFVVTDFVDRRRWIWTDQIPFLISRTRADRIAVSVAGLSVDAAVHGESSRRQLASSI